MPDLDWILWVRNQYNVPLWCGESGENSNVGTEMRYTY